MPVNRFHAFAEGPTFPAPERFDHLSQDDRTYLMAVEVWARFRKTGRIAQSVLLGPDAWSINLSGDPLRLSVGANSVVRGIIRVERDGFIRIGDCCYVGDDVILSAYASIEIESDVLIAHGVQVFDNISHPIDAAQRAQHFRAILNGRPYDARIPAARILIERNAWIGFNSIIMRDVRVGAGSIVAAGSVVVDDVPPNTIVAGNPARTLRKI
jgi:acetyltransferase-like isoleucine patch superfamily enzyme